MRGRLSFTMLVVSATLVAAEPRLALNVDGSDELRGEVRAALSVSDVLNGDGATPSAIVAAARADYARIVATLYEGGRYSPVVSIKLDGREAAQLSPFETIREVNTIDVTVDPGPRFTFGTARITPLPPGSTPPETFASGVRAQVSAVQDAVRSGVQDWRATGHAKAKLADQTITANHNLRRLDAILRLDPGPKLRFGDVVVTGNDGIRRTRIREIAGIPPGETYDPDTINRAEIRLRRTGAFRSVAIQDAKTPNPDGTLDLALQVAEEKPRRFGFGAEVSTQEGAKLSGFWLHRNLFGGAERLRIGAEIAGIGQTGDGIDYRVDLDYARPATFHPDMEFFLNSYIERRDDPGFSHDQFVISSGLSRQFTDHLRAAFELGYRISDTTDAFGNRQFELFTATLSTTLDHRNDLLNPTGGYFLSGDVTPFAGINGTESGLRATADARAYRALDAEARYVLAGRAQLGSVWGPDLNETVPDYLFYSGGGGTVRGQPFQSLGVTAPSGDLTGGQSFAALSAELRVKTGDNLGFVGFYDMGLISDDSGFSGNVEQHSGAGIGLRYDTGIGPIRVDVATPLSGNDAGQRVELYIGIGQAF